MADSCPVFLGDPALGFVNSAHTTFMQMALGTYGLATQQAVNLQSFIVSPVQYSAGFNFNDPLNTFQRPEKPTIDLGAFEFQSDVLATIPEVPEFDANDLDLEDAGRFNTSAPNLSFPNKPGGLSAKKPGDAPVLPERAAPIEPDYVLPAVPDINEIIVPLPPTITLPEFEGVRPEFDLPAILENWQFTPEEYVSALLDKTRAKISGMLDGGTGLPIAIWNALVARANGKIDEQELRAVDEAIEEYASKGFVEPSGILTRRLELVRQNNQNQRNETIRGFAIAEAEMEQKNLFFAVEKGIALEGVLVDAFNRAQALMLESARFGLDSSLRVFDAKVAVIRLQYEIFVAEANVFEARIRGELARAEVYKAEIEGAKVRGEIEEQKVRRYEAQIRAIGELAAFYNSRVNGFKAQVDADVSRVEAFKAVTQAYAEQVRAKEAEWGAYGKAVDAEATKVQVFDTLSRAFATRVSAASDKNRVTLALEQTRIQQHEAELRSWGAGLRQVELYLNAERERIQALTTAASARATIYASEAQVETAASASRDRTFQLGLERETQRATVALKDAEIRVNENVQLTGLLVEIQKTVATVLAQLSAGAMSAVNYSASVSSGRSESRSCQTSISFEGEV